MGWIEDHIRLRGLRTGDALPAEQEIAREAGAGRSSVREALTALKVLGLIVQRRKGGIRLARDPVLLELRHFFGGDLAATGRLPDAMEFRAAMEWGLGPMMLARSGPRLTARLTRIVARAESARHMANLNALDSAFHTALVAACGNRLAALFAGLYASLFHGQVEDPDCPLTSADRDRWMIQHGEFVKALANKDGPQFFNHLRKHTHSYMRGKAPARRSSGGAS